MLKTFYIAILFSLIVISIQLTVLGLFSVNLITPDLLLILVVYYGVVNGSRFGMLVGFSTGFILDLFSGGLIGLSMFTKTLIGFIAGYFYNENYSETKTMSINFSIYIFVCAFIDSIISALMSSSLMDISIQSLILFNGVFPAFYTALFSVPFILFLNWRGKNG